MADKDRDRMYYASSRSRKKTAVTVGVIFAVYMFFFLSKIIFPADISGEPVSIGEEIGYTQGRSVTVYDATYSKEQRQMEIVMSLENTVDSINDYYFFIDITGRHSYKKAYVEVVESDAMVTVLHINNLKKFTALNLIFAPKLSEDLESIPDSEVCQVLFTEDNIKTGKIKARSREEYIFFRISATVEKKAADIAALKDELAGLQEEKAAQAREKADIEAAMQYMTSAEKAEAERRQTDLAEDMSINEKAILDKQAEIAAAEQDLAETEELLETFGGNK